MNRLLLLALSAIAFGLTGPVLAQDDLLTPVKAAGTIRIPNTQGHVPWDFLDDKNELVGVELGREIAERMGIENVEFIPRPLLRPHPGSAGRSLRPGDCRPQHHRGTRQRRRLLAALHGDRHEHLLPRRR